MFNVFRITMWMFSHRKLQIKQQTIRENIIRYQINIIVNENLIQRKFYNRETNSATYSKCPSNPLPFYAIKEFSPFLASMISANHEKREEFQPYILYYFSNVEYLFLNHTSSLAEDFVQAIKYLFIFHLDSNIQSIYFTYYAMKYKKQSSII